MSTTAEIIKALTREQRVAACELTVYAQGLDVDGDIAATYSIALVRDNPHADLKTLQAQVLRFAREWNSL